MDYNVCFLELFHFAKIQNIGNLSKKNQATYEITPIIPHRFSTVTPPFPHGYPTVPPWFPYRCPKEVGEALV